MMTGSAIASIVQDGLNRALKLDPAGRRALLDCLAEPVQLQLTTPVAVTLTLSNDDPFVQVINRANENAAVIIRGGPIAIAALALGDTQVLNDGRLSVTGQVEKAVQFQQALSRLDPDWEAAMADHLGDVPAHFLGKRLREAVQWSRQAVTSLTANLEEYIHEEAGTLPGRRELAARTKAIEALQQRTATLDTRLTKLDSTDSDHQTETP